MPNFRLRITHFAALACGSAFGASTIFALIHGAEHYVALACLALIAAIAAFADARRPLLDGFIGGFLFALTALALQAAFLPLYFENNPDYAATELAWGLSPRSFILLFAPLGGLVAGCACALIAWLMSLIGRACSPAPRRGHDA